MMAVPKQPAVQEPKEIAELVEGMEVSIDVSTGDHDSGNRLFGTVTLAQENQGSKHGLILLVQNPEANFKTATPPAAQPAVQDADGENKAVRSFLMLYGQPGLTVGQMKKHMARSGFTSWPEWVETEPHGAHLTKAGAQLWIRHLFALEATPPAAPVQPVAQEPLTDGYVQLVPDKCDRIVWRTRYFHLPIANTPPAPAVPDAIHHTDLSEHPQYIEGWNDCRAEMLKGMKP